MEVNAGQFATFQCSASGGTDASDRLWLQVISFFPNALRTLPGGKGSSSLNRVETWAAIGLSVLSVLGFTAPLNGCVVEDGLGLVTRGGDGLNPQGRGEAVEVALMWC